MTTEAALGIAGFSFAVVGLGLALNKKAEGRRPVVLILAASLLGSLQLMLELSHEVRLLLAIASVLLGIAACWELFRKSNDHITTR